MSGSDAAGPGAPPGQDPTMEDILASIRRILNEDEAPVDEAASPPPVATAPEATALAPPPPASAVAPPPPPAPAIAPPPPAAVAPPPLDLTEAMMVPDPPATEPPARPAADALLAPAAAAATAAALGQLARAVATERGSAVHRGGPTIEDVVREELRPLLKQWLDANLPPLVERLVRDEIERVVSRAIS